MACDTTAKTVKTEMPDQSEMSDKAEQMPAVQTTGSAGTTFRSSPPAAGEPRSIEIGESTTMKLDNGLQVIIVENHKVPRVSWQLSLDTDPIVEGDKAGYVSFAGDLMSKGTTTRTKAEIDDAVDFMGASLNTSASGMFASSLTKHKENLLEIMTDVLYNPAFPEEELDKARTQTLSGLAQSKEDPNAISQRVSNALLYGMDHPYGEMMTEETVNKVTLADTKKFYSEYFKPDGAYLVVVGDITPAEAETLAKKYFGKWTGGAAPKHEYDAPKMPMDGPVVAVVNKDAAVQSVIRVANVVDLQPAADDIIAARVMNAILGGGVFSGRLMQNLREDKAYTYGARSSLSSDEEIGVFSAGASVRNEVTDSSVTEFLYEINRMRNEPVKADELSLVKNVLAGGFARSLESPQTIARFALNTQKYNLPDDYYENYLKKLDAVTVADVQRMAQKYIRPENMIITVVGNKEEISKDLETMAPQGKVMYYDSYGNEIKMSDKPVDHSITGESIIEDYISAIGGREALAKVENIQNKMTGNMMGQNIQTEVVVVKGKGMYQKTGSDAMVMMEQKYNGKRGVTSGMMTGGSVIEMGDAELTAMAEQALIYPELTASDRGVTYKFLGETQEAGTSYYKVQTMRKEETGMTEIDYYDQSTGLRAKKVITTEQGSQTFSFEDYKEVEGIMIPHKTSISGGGMPVPLVLATESYEVNGDVDMSLFFIE